MILSPIRQDRAAGVLLTTAAGDALGAGYEFTHPSSHATIGMVGGGALGWEPGEWTDDTSMAIVVAQAAATGLDLRSDDGLTRVARGFADWFAQHPRDVGVQTRQVLAASGRAPTGKRMRAEATKLYERTGRTAGNGSLMRTAPVALAYLEDPQALIEACMAVSALTHADPIAGEACAMWCLAIRRAVLGDSFMSCFGDYTLLDNWRYWHERMTEADNGRPADFANNGWVVAALQTAWWAIGHSLIPPTVPQEGLFEAQHVQTALELAVRAGGDTDTVAATAGGLLGAVYGASAVPAAWRRILHGWPGFRAGDLVRLGLGAAGYRDRPQGPTVVSADGARPQDDLQVWLLEPADGTDVTAKDNQNLDFVIDDTAHAIAGLREEGRTGLLQGAGTGSTAAVAARYAVLNAPADPLPSPLASLPREHMSPDLRDAVERLNCPDPTIWARFREATPVTVSEVHADPLLIEPGDLVYHHYQGRWTAIKILAISLGGSSLTLKGNFTEVHLHAADQDMYVVERDDLRVVKGGGLIPPSGTQAVQASLADLRKGVGTFDAVRAAVVVARFRPRTRVTSMKDLAEQWDYVPDPKSWNDTVQLALFMKVITFEQYEELSALAKFATPRPKRRG